MERERLTNRELYALDDEVAKRVMRWHLEDNSRAGVSWYNATNKKVRAYSGWRPTTRIECAWAAVEVLGKRQWEVSVTILRHGEVLCVATGGGGPRLCGSAATAPLAIVRAALKCADWEEAKGR